MSIKCHYTLCFTLIQFFCIFVMPPQVRFSPKHKNHCNYTPMNTNHEEGPISVLTFLFQFHRDWIDSNQIPLIPDKTNPLDNCLKNQKLSFSRYASLTFQKSLWLTITTTLSIILFIAWWQGIWIKSNANYFLMSPFLLESLLYSIFASFTFVLTWQIKKWHRTK